MGTREHGFTLWEVMMAVVVAGIVLGLAVPSFQEFQRSNAMAAAANDLVSGTLLARSEAVKRQVPVTLCITADPSAEVPVCAADPGGGFVVFVDEAGGGNAAVDGTDTVLLRSAAPGGRITVSMDHHVVTYGPNGFPRPAFATRFLFCDDRGPRTKVGGRAAARVMLIDPTGRGTIRSDAETVQAVIAGLDAECGE